MKKIRKRGSIVIVSLTIIIIVLCFFYTYKNFFVERNISELSTYPLEEMDRIVIFPLKKIEFDRNDENVIGKALSLLNSMEVRRNNEKVINLMENIKVKRMIDEKEFEESDWIVSVVFSYSSNVSNYFEFHVGQNIDTGEEYIKLYDKFDKYRIYSVENDNLNIIEELTD